MEADLEDNRGGVVGIAVDKDKSSELTVQWALNNLRPRSEPLKLIHVVQSSPQPNPGYGDNVINQESYARGMEALLPARSLFTRRYRPFETVILHDHNVAYALIDYASRGEVDILVISVPPWISISRLFKSSEVSSTVLKYASGFCTVYGVCKGKLACMRVRPRFPSGDLFCYPNNRPVPEPEILHDELSEVVVDDNNSIVSSGKQSPNNNCISFYENLGSLGAKVGSSSDIFNLDHQKSKPSLSRSKTMTHDKMKDLSWNEGPSFSQHNPDNIEDELRRHKIEFKRAMELYHAACREAKISKAKLNELQECNMKQEQRIKEVESENVRSKAAIEAAQKLAEQVVEKRVLKAEITAMKEADSRRMVLGTLRHSLSLVKYQSLFNVFLVLYLTYLYFSSFK